MNPKTSKTPAATPPAKAPRGHVFKAKAPKADASILAIHVNPAGRVCFGRNAAKRIAGMGHMLMTAEGNKVRLIAKMDATENTVEIHSAHGRPYVSGGKFLRLLGFDGRPMDFEAAPYGHHGFEFTA